MASSGSLGSRIALLLATLVFVLLLAEGAARLVVQLRERPEPPDPELVGLPVLKDVLSLAEPDVLGVHQGVRYRTNSRGVRGPEYADEASPGTFRILIAGDSVTAGWAVEEERAYPEILERLLNERPPAGPDGPQRFEVVNVGLAGVNAGFSSDRLRKFTGIYHPDLTVQGVTLNDIEGPHYRRRPALADKPSYAELWREVLRFQDSPSVLLQELWPRWIMLLEWDVFHRAEADRIAPMAAELRDNYFDNPEAWDDFRASLDAHAELASSLGLCGHVLVHTHLTELGAEHPYGALYRKIADAARASGLSVTESYPVFEGRDGRELWVHPFDVHPNARGHELLARALYDGLAALPPECWRGSRESRRRDAPAQGEGGEPSSGSGAAPSPSGSASR